MVEDQVQRGALFAQHAFDDRDALGAQDVDLLLVLAVAAVLGQKGILTVVLILGLTGWTGIYRLVRAEYMKHSAREYVRAAEAIGATHTSRMFVHILPNISHVVLVQLSLHVVSFIKAEVILSFLGFGVPVGVVSWGSMLNEAQNELILGKWWQLTAAATAANCSGGTAIASRSIARARSCSAAPLAPRSRARGRPTRASARAVNTFSAASATSTVSVAVTPDDSISHAAAPSRSASADSENRCPNANASLW